MSKGIFIVGTDTDVGKTFVTAGLNYILRKNSHNAISYKPVQSGGIPKDDTFIPGDIDFIKKAAGLNEDHGTMNAYCFKAAVSPHIAAELEDVRIDRQKIIEGYTELQAAHDYCIVEGAGGIVVPLIRDEYYIYDLVKDLDLPVLIVARAGVGTINHTVLTVNFLKSLGVEIRGIVINKYTGSYYEDDNIEVLKAITGLDVVAVIDDTTVGDPNADDMNFEDMNSEKMNAQEVNASEDAFIAKAREVFDRCLDIEVVLDLF